MSLQATAPAVLPASRVPDSMDAPPLRWGIMGPGWIAERFTESVQAHTRQVIAAVGSRSLERSQAFADTFGIAAAYGSYGELAAADIDIVYVATPHTSHHSAALAALAAGKHVLIEKPIGINAAQARDIRDKAAVAGLFAAEALWTFFLPKFDAVRQLLDAGALGTLTTVIAEYGEHFEPGHRIFDPLLAGGPLLDLGTYPLALVTAVLGAPDQLRALGTGHPSGVNGQISAAMSFPGGAHAVVKTQLNNFTPTQASLVGTAATLTLDGPFNMPGGFTLSQPDGTSLRYEEPAGAHFEGLHFEAAAVARAIHAGRTSVAERPLEASILTMDVADAIRGQLGITFPGE
ncbi:Gfo/Idh/MocA family protein [Arthrobacter sp. A2-55]|uniref:Gfo/Idh/MocA family protein n=1 Tax=Arthrobacter sp. A2-55 TaxID=2897337 RepID=UPI0021CDC6B7|nr:Gfo/Idh/MocA family oxidoreductase [Arthrobacter sp. A2-55]MCU6480930.1 Gfo/Idh/MocA family oxidoreductase [Arthrobacter sp. A2-55]